MIEYFLSAHMISGIVFLNKVNKSFLDQEGY